MDSKVLLLGASFLIAAGEFSGSLNAQTERTLPTRDGSVVPRLATPRMEGDHRSKRLSKPPSPLSERDLQYEELEHMVDAFELRNAILRNATELLRPTVVHIEAQKTRAVSEGRVIDEPVDEQNGSLVEEAGSGVIVRIEERYIVLTNRHVVSNTSPEYIRVHLYDCLLYTSPSPRDATLSRMPSSA